MCALSHVEPNVGGDRLVALDVLRGVALLGILLMNILGFGLAGAAYLNPLIGSNPGGETALLNLGLWALFDITIEGAMRALFSLLFGAGLVLFTTGPRAKSAAVHYRRQAWLLLFGLINGYLLLWPGDILVTYALCGMLLYPLRNMEPRSLMLLAAGIVIVQALLGALILYATGEVRTEALTDAQAALDWQEVVSDMAPAAPAIEAEMAIRRGGYAQLFAWNAVEQTEVLLVGVPTFLLWDALIMMLLGMACMRWRLLDASQPAALYQRLLVIGLFFGLAINGAEVAYRVSAQFAPLSLMVFAQPSYHLGRIAMAAAWLGGVMLLCQAAVARGLLTGLQRRLAAVGRMALSNYLLHSILALWLFTGAGLGWIGLLERWQLYLLVVAIWWLQLWISPWWLARFRFGPLEWLWRWLTYGRLPAAVP